MLQDWKSGLEFTENELREMGATLMGGEAAPKKRKKKKKKGWMSVPEDGDAPSQPEAPPKRSGTQEFRELSQGLDARVDSAFDETEEFTPSLPVMASGALQALTEMEHQAQQAGQPEQAGQAVQAQQAQQAEQAQQVEIPISIEEAPSAAEESTPPPPAPPELATEEGTAGDSGHAPSEEAAPRAGNSHEGVFKAFSSSGETSAAGAGQGAEAEAEAEAEEADRAEVTGHEAASSKPSLPPPVPPQGGTPPPPVPPEPAAEAHAAQEAPPAVPRSTGEEDDAASGPRETVRIYSGALNVGAAPPPVPGQGAAKKSAPPPPVPGEKPAKGAPPPVPPAGAEDGPGGPPPAPATEEEKGGAPPPPVPASKEAKAKNKKAPSGAKKKKRKVRKKPWFEDFFNDDYLLTLPYETPEATASEAKFIEQQLDLPKESRLLDVGCGYGRHAVELAKRDYKLVGLDNSLPMLLKAAEMGEQHGVEVNFMHGDMKEMTFEKEFDGVYCFNTSFGYFDDDTNRKVLRQVFKALKAGGRFLLEVVNRDFLFTDLPLRVWWEGDGCLVMEEVEFNYFTSRVESNRSVIFNDGRQVENKLSIRVYSLHELGKLLHGEGFIVREVTGNLATAGRFFGPESPHLIIKSEKKGK